VDEVALAGGAPHPGEADKERRFPMAEFRARPETYGVLLNDAGCVVVDDGYRTELPGVCAAGDLIYSGHQNVNTAIHMGAMAAAAMVLDFSREPRG
jgi:thioredoxin reductase